MDLHDRYAIERALGTGGHGEVVLALDRHLGRRVALKRMRGFHGDDLLRFKREFRALSGISHRNLVCLYDLFSERGDYYLSLEYVDGVPLVEYVRERHAAAHEDVATEDFSSRRGVAAPPDDAPQRTRRLHALASPLAEPNLPRLRAVFGQLLDALEVLHERGMVHRDLKPSNVLVTREGRVVVLDFGLVTPSSSSHTEATRSVLGTPFYMAPEQADGRGIGPGADLYAVGVMLFECLTGITPFEGLSPLAAIASKGREPPAPLRSIIPGAPNDLASLADELLRSEPRARPPLVDVRKRIVGRFSSRPPQADASSPRFVGRRSELARLGAELARVRTGERAFVCIEGESGMGKSALADQFLDQASREGALILVGRCYEHDALPNKLFDAVVDSLAATLSGKNDAIVQALLPPEFGELTRVFPVLSRFVAERARGSARGLRDEPREARRAAEVALAELISRLSDEQPIVMFVDDAQWGDVESLGFVRSLLAPAIAARLLLVFAYRTEEKEVSPLLLALERSVTEGNLGAPAKLCLEPLSEEDALALSRALATDTRGARLAELLAHEGRGHPLFIEELMRYVRGAPTPAQVRAPGDGSDLTKLDLAEVIVRRIEAQSDDALAWLHVLATLGAPSPPRVVARAAGWDTVDATLLHRLRAEHLVRRTGPDEEGSIVCYHDRIRESVLARMSEAERRDAHRRVADAVALEEDPSPSLLATHLYGAGETRRAAVYAAAAGERAFENLAFDEARAFFERALAWELPDQEARVRAQERVADALLNLGRCRDAADAFVVAAGLRAETDLRAALRLRTLAAEANLVGGDDERGRPMMRTLLEEVGTSFPDSEFAMKVRLGWNFVRLGTRLRVPTIAPRIVPAEAADRIDVLYAAQRSYALRDFPRAMIFGMEGFREALTHADASRVMEGLAVYASATSVIDHPRAPIVMQAALDLAERLGTDRASGLVHVARGTDLFARQHMFESRAHFRNAIERLGRCAGMTPVRIHAEAMEILLLRCLEDFTALRARCDAAIASARVLGNRYVEASARHDSVVAELAADDVPAAHAALDAALAAVPPDDLYVVYSALHYRTKCFRYVGDFERAVQTMDEAWGDLEARNLVSNRVGKLIYGGLRAGSLLGLAARSDGARRGLVNRARRALAPFRGATSEWAAGYRGLLEASLADLEGDRATAAALLATAGEVLARGRLPVFAATARLRHAQLAAPEALDDARATLVGLGVARPDAWADSVAPGFRR